MNSKLMIWFIFVFQISLNLFLVEAQQHLPPQLKHYHKSAMKIHTEEYELLSVMMHHPEFIYSSFMENQLKANASETLSQKCNTDVLRLIVDLASQEDYAIRSKLLHSGFLGRRYLNATCVISLLEKPKQLYVKFCIL